MSIRHSDFHERCQDDSTTSWAVGIDLGTTYSCIGVYRGNNVEIISNECGYRTTPSCVAFSDNGILVGYPARNQIARNPSNTIFAAKSLVGRKFTDTLLQEALHLKQYPFKVINSEGKPVIHVQDRGETKEFTPEEILSMILVKMKGIAESYLGHIVTEAVVTVPANFNNMQRQATKDAAVIAGLDVIRIIDEPTAASIAYNAGLKVTGKPELNILVFDCGGGTTNASLVVIDNITIDVKATGGDNNLGGQDFDNRLVNHFMQEFKGKFRKDLSTNPRALCRLRIACERAKRVLSSCTQTTFEIESIYDGIDFCTTISRTHFEALCEDLFIKALDPIQKVLSASNTHKSDIDEIVLVGCSTRIPRIVQLVSDFFNGKDPKRSMNPEEAIAYGATVHAAMLRHHPEGPNDHLLLDVVPFSLGIDYPPGIMNVVVMRHSSLPLKRSTMISTSAHNQTSLFISVYEGDRSRTVENMLLGAFEFPGIQPAPKGVPEIEVTFDMISRDIIHVSVRDMGTGKSKDVTISSDNPRIRPSWDESDCMMSGIEEY
ncbi:heat shock protein 70 [Rickenella mellea]|uniref:Heat shock protein 70 n=1 Tax=Rickenella mellea TaxID=50990 RepID=A0A4Y7PR10_9AGAM|nr:heat shock protein 70 [Rickenella mellea]